ncbi:XRE family transcriptional regulator [Azospirillum griseum]|uniref:XRE family transcriptional regulator n=1 Tax=Azospirillum griseum TaxID=2496639 RepID=A0A431VE44_9PROT|nr:XRE family transcriptional regulator [Azospirillum griseum]RTR17839.1 XRE family transcriptional regulator [Azospirillum griseum]
MTVTIPLDDILAAMPTDERAAVDARASEMLAEIDGLAELRRLVALTQGQVAEALNVKQPTIHQIEKRTDLYLSTLRRFVEAAGGELELRVSLPGKGAFKLTGVGALTSGS